MLITILDAVFRVSNDHQNQSFQSKWHGERVIRSKVANGYMIMSRADSYYKKKKLPFQ